MSSADLALVAGAGPGLGQSLLERFSAAGMTAIGLVRSDVQKTSHSRLLQCDIADPQQCQATIQQLIAQFGPPKIVVHNAAALVIRPFAETTLEDFEQCWRTMAFGAAVLGQSVLQPMVRGGGGSFIVSGATASLRGGAKFSAFASAKFALRGLTQALAREYQPAGIHVVHTILDGIIDSAASRALHSLDPSRMMQPNDIAEVYWQLSQQPRSTWSHEIDLRPHNESF